MPRGGCKDRHSSLALRRNFKFVAAPFVAAHVRRASHSLHTVQLTNPKLRRLLLPALSTLLLQACTDDEPDGRGMGGSAGAAEHAGAGGSAGERSGLAGASGSAGDGRDAGG